MKLTSLAGINVGKIKTFHDVLGDITIYVSPPKRGKTSRQNAATFLLLGHVPALGKLPSATAQMASGSPMVVEGLCSNGQTIRRTLERKGKSWTTTVSDNMPAVPPVLLSPGIFFEMGPTERTKFVFSRVTLDEKQFSTESIVNSVMGVTLPEGAENKEILDEIVGELRSASEERDAKVEHNDPTAPAIQDWLSTVIADVKERLKLAKKAVQRYVGHEQTSEEMEIKHGGAVSRGKDAIEADIRAAQTHSSTVSEARGKFSSKHEAQTKWRDEKKAHEDVVNDQESSTRATLLENTIKERDALAATTESYVSKTVDIGAKKTSAINNIRVAETAVSRIEQTVSSPDSPEIRRISGEISTRKGRISREREALTDAETLYQSRATKTCCPICATEGETFKVQIKQLHDASQAAINATISALESEVKGLETDLQAERARVIEKLGNEQQEAVTNLAQYRKSLADAEQELIVSRQADTANQGNRTKIRELNTQIGELRAKLEAFEKSKSILANYPTEDTEDYESRISAADKELADANSALQKLQQELRDLGAAEADAQRRALAEQERLRAKADEVVTGLVVDKLAELQDKAITASISPILTIANQFTNGLIETPLDLADGEFGRRENGQWISHAVFSGFEKLMAFSGISVALASGDSPFKLVMMDELGRMDESTKLATITRIQELIAAGVIEQFIGIDVTPSPYERIPGVKVINV